MDRLRCASSRGLLCIHRSPPWWSSSLPLVSPLLSPSLQDLLSCCLKLPPHCGGLTWAMATLGVAQLAGRLHTICSPQFLSSELQLQHGASAPLRSLSCSPSSQLTVGCKWTCQVGTGGMPPDDPFCFLAGTWLWYQEIQRPFRTRKVFGDRNPAMSIRVPA